MWEMGWEDGWEDASSTGKNTADQCLRYLDLSELEDDERGDYVAAYKEGFIMCKKDGMK